MACRRLSRPQVSIVSSFFAPAGNQRKHAFASIALLCLAFTSVSVGQDQPEDSQPPAPDSAAASQAPTTSDPKPITLPAGTRFALVLTNPVASKTMHRGDEIHTQTTAPITIGDQVVIPAGAFVQGRVDKLSRNGTRGQFFMQSVSVVFPDGYVANIAGPINMESDEGTAWRVPSDGAKVGAIAAPLAGLGLGALIGSAAHTTQSSTLGGTTLTSSTPKGLAIGSMVGLAAGGVVALVLLTHSQQFFVDAGSPVQMTLPQPLSLAQNQVGDANAESKTHPAPPIPVAQRLRPPYASTGNTGTCYTPDTPGSPLTMISGTPPIGDSPGTPEVTISGTPAIPGTPYPCP